MNPLPDSFLRPNPDPSKRGTSRPAPFSTDEFSPSVIEQSTQAYMAQIEQPIASPTSEPPQPESAAAEPTNVPAPPSPTRTNRRTKQPTAQGTPPVANEKANIRLEIMPTIRKDMIRIKHRVGIAHGVDVSYAAYVMFLHERLRPEHNTPAFLADLARFTEQLKHG
jgi:hypothetical protein